MVLNRVGTWSGIHINELYILAPMHITYIIGCFSAEQR